jgi:hypothetical protein
VGYINVLFAVPEKQVRAIQADSGQLLHPPSVVSVGHVWWLSEEAQPLIDLIGEVLDGGLLLSPSYRHPLRSPVYHEPSRVRDLETQLAFAWQQPFAAQYRAEQGVGVRHQFEQILDLFRRASARGECVVSVLLPPTNVAGFDWVKMPFAVDAPSGVSAADGYSPPPQRSSGAWSPLDVVASWSRVGIIGAVSLCLWRYRRLNSRSSGSQPPSTVAGDS